MPVYIDLQSIGPTDATALLRAELLGLRGLLLRRQDRDVALRSLSTGDSIVCQPSAFPFWRRLPPDIPIVYAEDPSAEDAPAARVDSWLLWCLIQLSLSSSEARVLMRKPPISPKHKHWQAWQTANDMAGVYEGQGVVTLPTLDVLGGADADVVVEARPYRWQLVQTDDGIDAAGRLLFRHTTYRCPVGVDVETAIVGDDANETQDDLVGVGLSFGDECFYGEASDERWLALLRRHLPHVSFVAWNAKYDLGVLRRHNIDLGPLAGDGMLAARLLGEPTAGLKDVVLRHYGVRMITYDDVTLGRKRSIRDAPPEQVAEYCSGDCYWGVRATTDLVARLSGQALKLYTDTDLPLVRTLVNMELRGIQLDVDSATEALADADEKLLALRGAIDSLARESGYVRPDARRVCRSCRNGKNKRVGCLECKGAGVFFSPNPLNPGSTAQLVDWLHGHLNIPVQALSRNTGAASVNSLALLRMQHAHPAVPILLNWRALERYREFLVGWLEDALQDGRIRTTFTNSVVASGRLSSRHPNLQQVSRPWRRHFVAPTGSVLLAADYTALEVRIGAFASRDSTLLAVMNADPDTEAGDLHAQNVYKLFNVPYEDQATRPDLRVRAKNYLFGAMYGSMGQEVQAVLEKAILSDPSLGTPPSVREISRGILNIHDIYPHYFREWWPFMIERAREQNNTAYTCFGRPRVIPDLTSGYKQQREAAERMCISQIIQGTAADIGRMACNLVDNLAGGRLLLQIHDELVIEVPLDGELDNYKSAVLSLMKLGQPLEGVPLIVKVGVGSTWLDAK